MLSSADTKTKEDDEAKAARKAQQQAEEEELGRQIEEMEEVEIIIS